MNRCKACDTNYPARLLVGGYCCDCRQLRLPLHVPALDRRALELRQKLAARSRARFAPSSIRVESDPNDPARWWYLLRCDDCGTVLGPVSRSRDPDPEWKAKMLAELGGVEVDGPGRQVFEVCGACAQAQSEGSRKHG